MRKTFLVFFVFLLQIYFISPTMCEETKVSGRDVWKHLNRFNQDEYEKWHNDYVLSRKDSKPLEPRSMEAFEAMADYLQLPKEIESTKRYRFPSLEANGIPGYSNARWPVNLERQESMSENGFANCSLNAYKVDCNQWSEDLTQIGTGPIRVYVGDCNTYQEARICLIQMIICGNMPPECYLSLYKIEKGPGDVCLVHMDGSLLSPISVLGKQPFKSEINDRRVAFIRGNMAIYLVSYYKNFGCMDLACRLDAFLVEQFEKAQKDEVKAEE